MRSSVNRLGGASTRAEGRFASARTGAQRAAQRHATGDRDEGPSHVEVQPYSRCMGGRSAPPRELWRRTTAGRKSVTRSASAVMPRLTW